MKSLVTAILAIIFLAIFGKANSQEIVENAEVTGSAILAPHFTYISETDSPVILSWTSGNPDGCNPACTGIRYEWEFLTYTLRGVHKSGSSSATFAAITPTKPGLYMAQVRECWAYDTGDNCSDWANSLDNATNPEGFMFLIKLAAPTGGEPI